MKFILYLFIFYVIYRLIRGLFRAQIVIKSFHYQDNRSYNEAQQEGKTTIKNPGTPKKPGKISSDAGEYIDYEELKD
jgi:hypothetical protein